MMESENVVNLDDYRALEDVIMQRLGADSVIVCAVYNNGQIGTFVPVEMDDLLLVYVIQTLKDRRTARVNDINS